MVHKFWNRDQMVIDFYKKSTFWAFFCSFICKKVLFKNQKKCHKISGARIFFSIFFFQVWPTKEQTIPFSWHQRFFENLWCQDFPANLVFPAPGIFSFSKKWQKLKKVAPINPYRDFYFQKQGYKVSKNENLVA